MTLLTDHLRCCTASFGNVEYSPTWFRRETDRLASFLDNAIQSKSPFILLFAPNHIKTIYSFFGITKSGRICVLVDPEIGPLELGELRAEIQPSAEIHINLQNDILNFQQEIIICAQFVDDYKLRNLDDVCMIVYSSADDGYAKGAMLTHHGMIANAESIAIANDVNAQSVSCALIPFHHLFSFQTGILVPCITESRTHILDISAISRMRGTIADLVKHRISHFYSVPLAYSILKRAPEAGVLFCKGTNAISGAAKLSVELFEHFRSVFGIYIREGYGLTESSPVCTLNWAGEQPDISSVGRPIPGCRVTICNDFGIAVKDGEIGEVCIEGPNVMKGYYLNPDATSKALCNGRLHTGDVGRIGPGGHLHLCGLKKRMLNCAGNKIYPCEVERLIQQYGIRNKVKVIGRSGISAGEDKGIALHIYGDMPAIDMKKWSIKNLTRYKVPSQIIMVPKE